MDSNVIIYGIKKKERRREGMGRWGVRSSKPRRSWYKFKEGSDSALTPRHESPHSFIPSECVHFLTYLMGSFPYLCLFKHKLNMCQWLIIQGKYIFKTRAALLRFGCCVGERFNVKIYRSYINFI
jgi:hypothetical protein